MSFLKSGGGGTTVSTAEPYAPAQPALNQILSEATSIYGQGAGAAGYVAPTTQTMEGLAQQEQMANLAAAQQQATLQGQYLNPFLSPIIQAAGEEAYSTVASQFSGAGRTPTSPVAQQTVADIVAAKALPFAFQAYGQERGRQESVAQRAPSLVQTGLALEQLQRQQQLAPFTALQQYAGIVSPIATGFPTRAGEVDRQRDNLTTLLGIADIASSLKGCL